MRSQISQVCRGQAKTSENFVGMLADGGRVMMDACGCFGEMDPGSQQSGWTRSRVIAFDERTPLFDMPIFHHLADG